MPFTYHCHSGQFCLHASGTLEDVVKSAIDKNFKILGLSEHAPRSRIQDLYPEEKHLTPENIFKMFSDYITEARRLKSVYKDKIKILVGVESEWIKDGLTTTQKDIFDKFSCEYIVGSLHHVKGIPIDFDLPTYQSALENCNNDVEELSFNYYKEQYDMINSLRPNIIGHFDLIRLFSDEPHILSERCLDIVTKSIKLAISYGALFEVNSRSLKKNLKYPYPFPDILQIIIKNGGKLTISDDSHAPDQLGLYYQELREYLIQNNVTRIYYLDTNSENNSIITKEYKNFFNDDFWSV
ncbi:putative histidinol-phosphatase [Smittium culicis]|uniref:Histidinol-phosphatase n=1 Tax=Smittium culicis TaxID=133412 RepID=A0A1R1Y8S8_9FUNG|nr:putative histidinol-phosphatase [Smittium culicis]